MAWFADLAGRAESLLNNLDEQTGAALRNHSVGRKKTESYNAFQPDSPWERKKRPTSRTIGKKIPLADNKSVCSESQRASPIRHPKETRQRTVKESLHRSLKEHHDLSRVSKTSSTRHDNSQYSLNNPPRTLVGDVRDLYSVDQFDLKHRRYSLPSDLELLSPEDYTYKVQNLEIENVMLKNELNVMNREVTELLDRLRKTEDGNNVDSQELTKLNVKLEAADVQNQNVSKEKETLSSQMEQLKRKVEEITNNELKVYQEQTNNLQTEVSLLKNRNLDLEKKCNLQAAEIYEKNVAQTKLENDLRHAQTANNELRSDLAKTTDECRRLEKDWESYKHRVKNMLIAKDNEIKAMQEGLNFTTDTKMLMEEIDNLKEERDYLSEAVAAVQTESNEMKSYIQKLETRHAAAERALREALKDERNARNRSDSQYMVSSKELKNFQIETGQTIASLRTALRDKEKELNHLRETSSNRTADSSALNVADYDVMHDTIENDKIVYLTQTLVQRQTKLDSLLAENNMLKIQLEKLNSKYKHEVANRNSHSVVHLQDGDSRARNRVNTPTGSLSALSLRIGIMMKRYPVIRLFFITYMVCLHFWVLTVLLTSTPENIIARPSNKS